jgi:2-polyprenyl-6-methoxyphenol hydroxylase-like FAD-dependent oxidoreductase
MPGVKSYDVVVAGGGVAGVAAAVAAARRGARVALIEKQCLLGGLATSGMIYIYLPICDGYGHVTAQGLAWEMMKRSVEYGPFTTPPGWAGVTEGYSGIGGKRFRCCFSPGGFELSLDKMLEEADVDLWLDTRVVGVETQDKRIVALQVANDSGLVTVSAKCFVDATGGAYLVQLAGGKVGRDENFMAAWWMDAAEHPEKYLLTERVSIQRLGKRAPEFAFGECRDGRDVTRFVRRAWSMLRDTYDALPEAERKKNFPVQLPSMPQLRKIARIDALYNLADADQGGHFDDSVGVVSDWRRAGPVWETPYRSLLPREVRGVLAAGRCMGTEGLAWEIFRVIPAAVVTGEAAGVAAALAADKDCDPVEIPAAEVRACLSANGCILDAAPEFGVDPGDVEKAPEYSEN